MPAATTKADLIAVTAKEFTKLWTLVQRVDPETAMRKDVNDTSIKDVIAHRAHWIDLFLEWYADGQAG
ncbi:MAG: ClbS/DfsB family four-helix bundle protein [Pseudomonadota bacterium]